jgi:hypothetical protein
MGSGPILLSNLYCTGSEDTLLGCNRNMYGALSCTHRQDAGVECEGEYLDTVYVCIFKHALMYNTVPCTNGDVRLVEHYIGSGRIEVCDSNSWGTICSNSWDDIAASVACNQLGYSLYGTID